MTCMKIRIIKHEVVPDCGSCEVRFPDGRPSKYFYFENLPGRRLRVDSGTGGNLSEHQRTVTLNCRQQHSFSWFPLTRQLLSFRDLGRVHLLGQFVTELDIIGAFCTRR